MSMNYRLHCWDCDQHVWIGQVNGSTQAIYSNAETQAELAKFLWAHEGHSLEFGSDDAISYEVDLQREKA